MKKLNFLMLCLLALVTFSCKGPQHYNQAPVKNYKIVVKALEHGTISATKDDAPFTNFDSVPEGTKLIFTLTPEATYKATSLKIGENAPLIEANGDGKIVSGEIEIKGNITIKGYASIVVHSDYALFDGYNDSYHNGYRGVNSDIIIIGKDFNKLDQSDFENVSTTSTSGDITITDLVKISDSEIKGKITVNDITDNNTIGQTVTITIGPLSTNVPLHTLKIDLEERKVTGFYSIPDNGAIAIPEGITTIGAEVFKSCDLLETVKLPSTLKTIGEQAFSSCKALKELDLSKTKVETIGMGTSENGVFESCELLETVKFPSTLKKIGKKAFYECKALKEIDLSKTQLETIGVGVFLFCSKLETVKLPSTLKAIGEGLFCSCKALKELDLSKTKVETIGAGVFEYCDLLETVKFPSTLKTIGESAFHECRALKEIDLSETQLETIGDSAFNGCELLETVKFPSTLKTIGGSAFFECKALKEIDLSETQLETIKSSVFSSCYLLETVKFPSTLKTIGISAFKSCRALKEIDLSETQLETIGQSTYTGGGAFESCKLLETVKFPSTLKIIWGRAFYGCKALKEIDLSKTQLETIKSSVFSSCSQLETVKFPSTLKKIGKKAFYECKALKEIDLSKTQLETIGMGTSENGVFESCELLETVKFPSTLKTIETQAFANCYSLKTAVFPEEITSGWTANGQAISADNLKDSSLAALHLKNTYVKYEWNRN